MRILGISGSLGRGQLLRAAASELPPDTEFVMFEQLAAVPAYSEDLDGGSPPARRSCASDCDHASRRGLDRNA